MTTNGNSSTAASWRPAVPCPRDELGITPVGRPRTGEQVLEGEIAAQVKAYSDANAGIAGEHQRISTACVAVVDTYRNAESAIGELRTFVSVGLAADARARLRKVIDRHADDGPEDRRRVVAWARWLFWPAAILSGFFDGVYLAKIFQQILNAGPSSPLYWTSYIPAFGVMVCLLVVGTLLAQAVFRHRSRAERRLDRPKLDVLSAARRLWTWRDGRSERSRDGLPWPSWTVPVLFTAAVFAVLSSWTQIRAILAAKDNPSLATYEPYVASMLVLLAAGVVVLKFVAYNPYADSAAEADKLVRRARTESEPLLAAARAVTTKHCQAWLALQACLASCEAKAKRVVEEAVVGIREQRAHTGQMSELQPRGMASINSDLPAVDTHPGTVGLGVDLGVLSYGRDVLGRYRPRKLEQKLKKAVYALDQQFQP